MRNRKLTPYEEAEEYYSEPGQRPLAFYEELCKTVPYSWGNVCTDKFFIIFRHRYRSNESFHVEFFAGDMLRAFVALEKRYRGIYTRFSFERGDYRCREYNIERFIRFLKKKEK